MKALFDLAMGDPLADRVVPPTGLTTRLTVFVAAAMAFLAVLALALSLTAGRVADRWADELAQAATLRLPADAPAEDVDAALQILATTPGVAAARALSEDEQQALLSPWLGETVMLDALPVPPLVEIIAADPPYDPDGLRARFAAELPGAVLDDHRRWRAPLQDAASRLRVLGWLVLGLIGLTTAAMIALAAGASLAANAPVIRVLRLVGARDFYIARAFVRRFTLRAFLGALGGTGLALLALQLFPDETAGGFLAVVGFRQAEWLWPLAIPFLAAIVAFAATRAAALARLKEQT